MPDHERVLRPPLTHSGLIAAPPISASHCISHRKKPQPLRFRARERTRLWPLPPNFPRGGAPSEERQFPWAPPNAPVDACGTDSENRNATRQKRASPGPPAPMPVGLGGRDRAILSSECDGGSPERSPARNVLRLHAVEAIESISTSTTSRYAWRSRRAIITHPNVAMGGTEDT